MKLKTAIIIIIVACILGAAHYNDQITISVTLPSPAQVVDTVSKVASEMTKESDKDAIDIEVHDNFQHSASVSKENTDDNDTDIYRIRTSWNDSESQLGAYTNSENAITNCPIGYYVFNNAGEIIYTPSLS